jgi:cytoskeletal protein CcmA (bactofilin family)
LAKGGGGERLDVRQTGTGTVIARETHVEGDISGKRAVRIEGSLKGGVRLQAPLEIIEGAQVEADIHATVVRVAGTVTGNVTGGELVELLASAVVKGDVAAPALHVVEGARLEGRVQMRMEKAGDSRTG